MKASTNIAKRRRKATRLAPEEITMAHRQIDDLDQEMFDLSNVPMASGCAKSYYNVVQRQCKSHRKCKLAERMFMFQTPCRLSYCIRTDCKTNRATGLYQNLYTSDDLGLDALLHHLIQHMPGYLAPTLRLVQSIGGSRVGEDVGLDVLLLHLIQQLQGCVPLTFGFPRASIAAE